MASMLDAALAYAAIGIPVHPLQPRSKKPATRNGFKDATTDTETIRKWWGERPMLNIGGAMGDGIVCLDFDCDDGYDSRDWLAEWETENGKLPETATAVTGRGGMHMFYRVDRPVKKSENGELHIDIRADGSYAMLAPSIHPNGNKVFWDLSPEDVGIADADELVYKLIADVRPPKHEREGKLTMPDVIHEGEGRDNALYRLACSLWAQNMPESSILAALRDYNVRCCKPPMLDSVIVQKVESATKNPRGLSDEAKAAQKKKQERGGGFRHNEVARELIEKHGACMIDGVTPALRVGGERYEMGWDAYEREIIKLHDDCKANNRREVMQYVRVTAPRKRQSPYNLIAFANGVLDISTMELRGWRDDDVIANVIPHRWEPTASSELLFDTLEKMACGDSATMMNLAEFIGICMIRSNTRMPYYPVLIGEGSNGKSTYIKLLKSILGIENISALQPKEISAHFMGEHIMGKLANLGDDIADAYLDGEDCGAIKRISTGENIFTDVKGTKGYYFEPYCTMVFSCNTFPRCKDTTDGFMRRLFPIEFNATFSPDDPDYDPLITEKLMGEDVLEAACVVGVDGLRRALAHNQPTPNRYSAEVKKAIAAESNTALQWITDEGIRPDDVIGKTKDEVYTQYVEWCGRNGYSKTAIASGTLIKFFSTIWHISLSKMAHRDYSTGRRTVRVFEQNAENVPNGATTKEQVNHGK